MGEYISSGAQLSELRRKSVIVRRIINHSSLPLLKTKTGKCKRITLSYLPINATRFINNKCLIIIN